MDNLAGKNIIIYRILAFLTVGCVKMRKIGGLGVQITPEIIDRARFFFWTYNNSGTCDHFGVLWGDISAFPKKWIFSP